MTLSVEEREKNMRFINWMWVCLFAFKIEADAAYSTHPDSPTCNARQYFFWHEAHQFSIRSQDPTWLHIIRIVLFWLIAVSFILNRTDAHSINALMAITINVHRIQAIPNVYSLRSKLHRERREKTTVILEIRCNLSIDSTLHVDFFFLFESSRISQVEMLTSVWKVQNKWHRYGCFVPSASTFRSISVHSTSSSSSTTSFFRHFTA